MPVNKGDSQPVEQTGQQDPVRDVTDASLDPDESKDTKDAKLPKKTLFYDLSLLKDKKVSISLVGGKIVTGKLLEADEVANCVLLSEQGNTLVVLGQNIANIFSPDSITL